MLHRHFELDTAATLENYIRWPKALEPLVAMHHHHGAHGMQRFASLKILRIPQSVLICLCFPRLALVAES